MSQQAFNRAADVVWRLAGDRVIARHASVGADEAGVDLTGLAAMVWVVLDEFGTVTDVEQRLSAEGLGVPIGEVEDVLGQLVEAGWVRRSDGRGTTG